MTDYSDSFEATWKLYPKRNGKKVGKFKAANEWKKLSLDEQRLAYADIKARNMSGGWEFVKDMERYLKYRGWEDEWQGQRVTSDPDLLSVSPVTADDLCDYAMANLTLCEHQTQRPWNYHGPEPGIFMGVVIPPCDPCGMQSHRVQSKEIPA